MNTQVAEPSRLRAENINLRVTRNQEALIDHCRCNSFQPRKHSCRFRHSDHKSPRVGGR
jgi:hypothetical protein